MQSNAVFVRLSDDCAAALRDRSWIFYQFIGGGARFMFAWDACIDSIEALAQDLRDVAACVGGVRVAG